MVEGSTSPFGDVFVLSHFKPLSSRFDERYHLAGDMVKFGFLLAPELVNHDSVVVIPEHGTSQVVRSNGKPERFFNLQDVEVQFHELR